jgi:acyl-CoA thioester hydrolase
MTKIPDSGYIENGTHYFPVRIYYESTDAVGVTYYGEYLRFAERARTEYLRLIGICQNQLRQEENCLFVVRRANIDYKKSSKLDDVLTIETTLKKIEGVRLLMEQSIKRNKEEVTLLDIEIVCIKADTLGPTRVPKNVINKFTF